MRTKGAPPLSQAIRTPAKSSSCRQPPRAAAWSRATDGPLLAAPTCCRESERVSRAHSRNSPFVWAANLDHLRARSWTPNCMRAHKGGHNELEERSMESGGRGRPNSPARLSAGAAEQPRREDRLVDPPGQSDGDRGRKTGDGEKQLPERKGLRQPDRDRSPGRRRAGSFVCRGSRHRPRYPAAPRGEG